MRSEDRKRFTQRAHGNEERASRVPGARTRDAGASDEVSDVTRGTGAWDELDRTSSASEGRDPGPAERVQAMATSEDSDGSWAPEPNIVPEDERSQR
jgi:hypothetical protein